jgi:hypothetical protein
MCEYTLTEDCRSTKKKKKKPITKRTDEARRCLCTVATAADDWNVVMDCDQDSPKLPTYVFNKKEKKYLHCWLFLYTKE